MLTFEDFFAKKKIDLTALKKANSDLYKEFYMHYHAMGEKSFDHTKKFWFNRLRKNYRLDEPEVVVAKDKVTESVVKVTETTSSSLGFRAKFKGKPKTEEADIVPASEIKENTEENTPSGFKPRFKAGVTKSAATENPETPVEPSSPAVVANEGAKPSGFKPRFKAGVTKSAATENPETAVEPSSSAVVINEGAKPSGFKPRFEAGVTKSAATENPETAVEPSSPAVVANEGAKPSGFKPRFKAGVTKIKSQNDNSENEN
jgi:hypothetical protein